MNAYTRFTPRGYAFVASLFIFALLASACAPSAKDVAVELATIQAGQVQTLTAPSAPSGGPAATSPGPVATAEATAPVSVVPTATTEPTPRPGCMAWSDFKALAAGKSVYELIDVLDQQTLKRDHPESEGKWRVTETSVVWTGLYVDDVTLGGKAKPIAVDGKTGTWLIQGPVTVPTAGGEICLVGYDGTMPATARVDPNRQGGVMSATECVAKDPVVALFNSYKDSDPNRIYRELDQMANQNPEARLRFGGEATFEAKNTRTLVWAQSGSVSGKVLELDRTETKSIWLATADGNLTMGYPFSGLMLCDSINPERDFPWWGS